MINDAQNVTDSYKNGYADGYAAGKADADKRQLAALKAVAYEWDQQYDGTSNAIRLPMAVIDSLQPFIPRAPAVGAVP